MQIGCSSFQVLKITRICDIRKKSSSLTQIIYVDFKATVLATDNVGRHAKVASKVLSSFLRNSKLLALNKRLCLVITSQHEMEITVIWVCTILCCTNEVTGLKTI